MLMSPWRPVIALALALTKAPNYLTGKIAEDERVVFFPTAANKINSTHWQIPIHGWIFEPELTSTKRKVFVKALQHMFQVKNDEEKKILKKRIMPFTADNQSLQYVKIRIGKEKNMIYSLPRSSKDGHFMGNLTLHEDQLDINDDGIVAFEAVDRDMQRIFPGQVHLVPPTGISIISDIDDTIKLTNYLDKKEFYKNTFIREFQAVPGMSDYFQHCKLHYENCFFHYVSASPYQLFEELDKFFQQAGFPPATFHLKKIRVKDKTLLQLFADPFDYKLQQIEPILKRFPKRKFILIDDSGEKDPEVYAEIYRKYPSQIEKIWIRNVNNASEARMTTINRVQNPERWQYFNNGSDL